GPHCWTGWTRWPMSVDLRCYLVTSGTGPHTIQVAARAAAAGAGMVQVRAKESSTAELLDLTCAVAEAVAGTGSGTRGVVNDRGDVAVAAQCARAQVHGVHLGEDDLPASAARDLRGSEAIIGQTTGTLELVRRAERDRELLDYIGAGPYRRTPTKDSG